MDTLKILNEMKDFVVNTSHPQIKKSDIQFSGKDGEEILSFYLNPLTGEKKNDNPIKMIIELFNDSDDKMIFFRIFNFDIDAGFISKDPYVAEYELFKILMDLPFTMKSIGRFARSYESKSIEVHMFRNLVAVLDNETLSAEKFTSVLNSSFLLLNRIHQILFEAKVNSLVPDVISQEDADQKIQIVRQRLIDWFNFEEDKI